MMSDIRCASSGTCLSEERFSSHFEAAKDFASRCGNHGGQRLELANSAARVATLRGSCGNEEVRLLRYNLGTRVRREAAVFDCLGVILSRSAYFVISAAGMAASKSDISGALVGG